MIKTVGPFNIEDTLEDDTVIVTLDGKTRDTSVRSTLDEASTARLLFLAGLGMLSKCTDLDVTHKIIEELTNDLEVFMQDRMKMAAEIESVN